ncbi:alpha/beta hydrolase [Microbacterium enclense]|uniref:alpha/beta hydrolase n=1 Tax=Microbacterium enclense TaxID=993073 RepID=UPI0036DD475F
MRVPRVDDLPRVVEEAVLSDLGARLELIAGQTSRSMADVEERWRGLGEHDVFDVAGTEEVGSLLASPARDAGFFADALRTARDALSQAETEDFAPLRTRRAELEARIPTVVAEYETAADGSMRAEAEYRSAQRTEAGENVLETTTWARVAAHQVLQSAEEALDDLRRDVQQFEEDVEEAEDRLSSRLRGIAGGTTVHDGAGSEVRVAQDFWGFFERAYPGAPAAATTSRTLSEQLTHVLGRSTERRIEWLSKTDPRDATTWLKDHPDFLQSIAFVDAGRAARLFAEMAAASSAAEDGEWNTGPLGQLMTVAPLAVGNLNGIPTAQKDLFNRKGLTQMLAREDLVDEARSQLNPVPAVLSRGLVDDLRPSLLSLFLDGDGLPRASVAFGDIDRAGQVTTFTHGMNTNLGSLLEWSEGTVLLHHAVNDELRRTDSGHSAAIVLVMDWDSGSIPVVAGMERPDAGAVRLEATWAGVRHANPDAQINAVGYSLGTTMTAQAVGRNPGMVSHVWLFGSAGLTEEASASLAEQVRSGETSLSVTEADADQIAGWGRAKIIGSQHPNDPRDIPDAEVFGSDGGWVVGFGSDEGEYGEATQGHNAHEVSVNEFAGWVSEADGTYPTWRKATRRGYLDPSAESFKSLVVGLRESLCPSGRLR